MSVILSVHEIDGTKGLDRYMRTRCARNAGTVGNVNKSPWKTISVARGQKDPSIMHDALERLYQYQMASIPRKKSVAA